MNVVITGASSGIGLEIARQLSERGENVFVVCRKKSAELEKFKLTIIEGIELTSSNLEKQLSDSLKGIKIDWLVNNAGVFEESDFPTIDPEKLRYQFEVNAVAPLRVTQALSSHFNKNAKIAMVSSQMGSIEETTGGYYGYRMSKAALNMAGRNLSQELKGQGISVVLLHPGYVKTKMTGFKGEITPEVSASGLIKIIDELNVKKSGSFWHTNGNEISW
jgi:NAD(P)-dependent dehydrogenase (short-subunit alcohol dehydrogenase family)